VPNCRQRAARPALPSILRQLVEFSRTECRTCAVFLMQDRDTQRVYRLYDFTNAHLSRLVRRTSQRARSTASMDSTW
jgi:hypothetical protein